MSSRRTIQFRCRSTRSLSFVSFPVYTCNSGLRKLASPSLRQAKHYPPFSIPPFMRPSRIGSQVTITLMPPHQPESAPSSPLQESFLACHKPGSQDDDTVLFLLNTLSDFLCTFFLNQCSNYKLILKNFNLLFGNPKFCLVIYLRPS